MFCQTTNVFAQSGQKWSVRGNNISNGDFFGTKNNQDFLIKVNNVLQLTIKTDGLVKIQDRLKVKNKITTDTLKVNNKIKAPYLSGNGISLLQANNNGVIKSFLFPSDTNTVLFGSGNWKPLPPDNGWQVDGNNMYAIPSGNVGIGIYPTKKLDVNGSVLVRDSLGIGVSNPQAPLDVQGDMIVRGWIYAQNGVVVGKRFEGQKVQTDTIESTKNISKISQTDTLTSQKINASKIKVDGIIINGPNNRIYSTSGNLSFNNTNLNDVGTLNADTVHTNNLQVNYTTFDSLRVFNEIKIGTNSLSIAGNAYTGTTDQILSNEGKITLGGSPELTNIKIGIGTDDPAQNLHIKGTTCFGCPFTGPKSTTLRIEDEVVDDGGNFIGSSFWDVIVSGASDSKLYFQSSNATDPNEAIMTLTQNGNVGIGTENPQKTLDVNGDVRITGLSNPNNETQIVVADQDGNLATHSMQTVDNLGNHTATENLKMDGHNIVNGKDDDCFSILQNTNSSDGPTIEMYGKNHSDRQGQISLISYGNTGDFVFTNYNSGSWHRKVTIKADGNVGIGTSNPNAMLGIVGTLSVANKLIDLQQGYSIYSDNTGSGCGGTTRLWIEAPNEGSIVLGPRASANTLDNVRIRANKTCFEGNVGIGTTAPDYPFVVSNTQSGYDYANIVSYSNSDGVGFGLFNPQRKWELVNIVSSVTDYFAIRDQTEQANRLIIDQNGNVGIGTVPLSDYNGTSFENFIKKLSELRFCKEYKQLHKLNMWLRLFFLKKHIKYLCSIF